MSSPLIVALDTDYRSAINLAKQLDPKDCRLKIGSALFTSHGPKIIEKLIRLDFEIFLDLKFHDIPNSVENSIKSALDLGIWMVNIHASGGSEMLKAASSTLSNKKKKPILIGVTLLTSLEESSLKEIGIEQGLDEHVLNLAKLCKINGLDGVVCSPRELKMLRKGMGKDFILVSPGIRSSFSDMQDQKRTASITEALVNGADYLVIGREIVNSLDPLKEVNKINKEI